MVGSRSPASRPAPPWWFPHDGGDEPGRSRGVALGPAGGAAGGTQSYLGSRAYTIYGGASEVQKDIIAKNVLGLKAKSKAS